MTYRVKNIGIAVILAAFAGLLTIFYVTQYKRHVQNGQKNVPVLVAARDIPAGTTGAEVVGQHYFTTETVAKRTIVPGAVSNTDELNNLVVTQQVFRGEQITTRAFGTATELGIRAQIRANERAFQLPGDANQVLAGTLKEGDHVDVVANWSAGNQSQNGESKVILRNLLVLQAPDAPGKNSSFGSAPGQGNFSVQLRMTDAQSQKLFWAEQNGKLSLEIRPPADSQDSAPSLDNAYTVARSRG